MTEKTLSQRLPVGDPRNKVEFLADEFEKVAADLYARLNASQGQAPKKPLVSAVSNGDFVGNMGKEIFVGAASSDDVNCSLKNGRLSYPIGDAWSFETEGHTSDMTSGRALRTITPDTFYGFMGRDNNGVIQLHSGPNRSAIYQVLSPRRNTAFKEFMGSVRVLEQDGMTINIGLKTAQVDKNGFLRVTHPEKRLCETSYTHVGFAYPALPRIVETPKWYFSRYSNDFEVLYIEAVGGGMLNITDAMAWALGTLTEAVELVHREPEFVGQYREELKTADGESVTGTNEFKYRFINSHHCVFHPQQHIAITHVDVDGQGIGDYAPVITEITNEHITVSYPQSDADFMKLNPNRLVYSYGANPSSLGFYDSHQNWLDRK